MTRVSLKEAYDNKDVVAQIYAIRDTAESAEDTAEQAVTTANTASDHVDALVPQVEGAVENANSASASAQASAQTVAGYENRLGAVETGLGQTESDLSAVTLRVTTAEGQIVTIQGRVTALETADGQNVKINAINNYAVGLTGNQDVDGLKNMLVPMDGGYMLFNQSLGSFPADTYVRVYRGLSYAQTHLLIYGTQANNGLGFIDLMVGGSDQYDRSYLISKLGVFNASGFDMVIVQMAGYTEVWIKRVAGIGYLSAVVTHAMREFVKTNVVAGTGLTTAPAVGGTNPITAETITGVRVVS